MAIEDLFQGAIEQAEKALKEQEVAIGCIFVFADSKEVIARNRNSVNATKNATRHAELNCIEDTLKYCSENNLNPHDVWPKLEVYVTCEPCIMCARILRKLNFKRVYFGCSNPRFGGCKSVLEIATENKLIEDPPLEFHSGIFETETINLLRKFYAGENPNAPIGLRRIKNSASRKLLVENSLTSQEEPDSSHKPLKTSTTQQETEAQPKEES